MADVSSLGMFLLRCGNMRPDIMTQAEHGASSDVLGFGFRFGNISVLAGSTHNVTVSL